MKMNHEWTRRDTKIGAPPPTTSGTKLLLQFGALGVTMSWDKGFPGARASRPHQAWHSLGHLPHLDQTGTAPWLSFGLAAAVPADRVAACSIALKLNGGQRNKYAGGTPALPGDKEQDAGGTPALPGDKGQDAGGTPALPGVAVPGVRGGCLAGNFSESPRAPFGKLPFVREPGPRPAVRIIRGETADG